MYSMYGIWDTSDRRRLANWNPQLTLFALEESQNQKPRTQDYLGTMENPGCRRPIRE